MTKYVAKEWVFDSTTRTLKTTRSKSEVLPNKVSLLLELLCEHSGDCLDRYIIMEKIWGDNLTVADRGLRQVIWELRRHLPVGDDDEKPIINVPRKGYMLRDEVTLSKVSVTGNVLAYYKQFTVLLLVTAAVWYLTNYFSNGKLERSILEAEPVTVQSGYEDSPVVTPDGTGLLYSAKHNGQFEIYYKELNAPELADKLFLQHAGDQGGMAWNQSGNKLAYLSTTEQAGITAVSIYDDNLGTSTKIADQYAPVISQVPYGLAWSPVNDVLAYTGVTGQQNKSALFLYDVTKQQHSQLTNPEFIDMHPSWSPDGQTVTFLRLLSPELSGLFSVNVATGAITDLTKSNVKIYGHLWLDKQYILYSAYDTGHFYPNIINTKNYQSEQLSIHGNFKFPTASEKEIFYSHSVYEQNIQQYHFASGQMKLVDVIDSAGINRDPFVHDATGRLVFLSERTGSRELWYREHESSEPVQLTRAETTVGFPSFSESGDKVIYRQHNPESSSDEVHIFDLNGMRVTELGITGALHGVFAGDDRYIVYLMVGQDERELWLYDLLDHSQVLLTKGIWTILGSNQNKQRVYLVKSGEIVAYSLIDSQLETISKQPNVQEPIVIKGDVLYHFVANEQGVQLVGFNLENSEEQVLLSMDKILFNNIQRFTVNPQSGQLYLDVASKQESDIYKFSRNQLQEEIDRLFD